MKRFLKHIKQHRADLIFLGIALLLFIGAGFSSFMDEKQNRDYSGQYLLQNTQDKSLITLKKSKKNWDVQVKNTYSSDSEDGDAYITNGTGTGYELHPGIIDIQSDSGYNSLDGGNMSGTLTIWEHGLIWQGTQGVDYYEKLDSYFYFTKEICMASFALALLLWGIVCVMRILKKKKKLRILYAGIFLAGCLLIWGIAQRKIDYTGTYVLELGSTSDKKSDGTDQKKNITFEIRKVEGDRYLVGILYTSSGRGNNILALDHYTLKPGKTMELSQSVTYELINQIPEVSKLQFTGSGITLKVQKGSNSYVKPLIKEYGKEIYGMIPNLFFLPVLILGGGLFIASKKSYGTDELKEKLLGDYRIAGLVYLDPKLDYMKDYLVKQMLGEAVFFHEDLASLGSISIQTPAFDLFVTKSLVKQNRMIRQLGTTALKIFPVHGVNQIDKVVYLGKKGKQTYCFVAEGATLQILYRLEVVS